MRKLSFFKFFFVQMRTRESLENVWVVKNSSENEISYQNGITTQYKIKMVGNTKQQKEKQGKNTTSYKKKYVIARAYNPVFRYKRRVFFGSHGFDSVDLA